MAVKFCEMITTVKNSKTSNFYFRELKLPTFFGFWAVKGGAKDRIIDTGN